MQMQPVTDTRLKSIGYDINTMTMRVEFPNKKEPTMPGMLYDYAEVPPEVHEALVAAEKPGSYFAAHIQGTDRSNPLYKYTKVTSGVPTTVSGSRGGGKTDAMRVISEGPVTVITEDFLPGTRTIEHPTAVDARAKAAVAEILPASTPVPAAEELPTEHTALLAHAQSVRARVQALVKQEGVKVQLAVTTPEAYQQTAELFVALAKEKKAAQALCDQDRKPHNEAYKAAQLREKLVMAEYAILDTLDSALTAYRTAEREARQKAERLEQQRQQKLLDDAAADRARESKEQADREAAQMEAAGQPEVAQMIRQAPAPVIAQTAAPVVFARETPRTEGIRESGTWMNEVENAAMIPLFFRDRIRQAITDEIAKEKSPLDDNRMARLTLAISTVFADFYSLDQVKINGFIKPKKELGINLVPGLKVWFKEKTSTTGR